MSGMQTLVPLKLVLELEVWLALSVLTSWPSISANCSLVLLFQWSFDHEEVEEVGLLAVKLVIGLVVRASSVITLDLSVVATTCRNGTRSLLTSAKLSVGYLVVGITRELDKEPSLYYPIYIYMASGPCYNNIYPALKSMPLPHVLLLIHMCFP